MAFSFGFSGDDIDIDAIENDRGVPDVLAPQETSNTLPALVKASHHDMNEWLSLLPSQISFNRLAISGTPVVIARREIFDIRAQLMAEDTADHDNLELIAGLEKGDLKPHFYEGGFKTWECSLDLAKLVASQDAILESLADLETDIHIIELGAGTAVPSIALFAYILDRTESLEHAHSQRKLHFTFADYNDAVLRLVTLPNLLLTWCNTRSRPATPDGSSGGAVQDSQEEELDVTPQLLDEFKNDLARRGIVIDFISGAWSPDFVDLVFSIRNTEEYRTLIMASETIYSPSSLKAFSETLFSLLRRSSTDATKSRALVAAKKVYFGVGGGVDEFLAMLKELCAGGLDVQQKLDVQSEGVGRVVLEITPASNM